jgi:hypothetical protein
VPICEDYTLHHTILFLGQNLPYHLIEDPDWVHYRFITTLE